MVNADVRLWPRVEICRAFVLSELRRILYFEQNRVEVRFPGPKRVILVSVRRALIVCFLRLPFFRQFRLEMRREAFSLDLFELIR